MPRRFAELSSNPPSSTLPSSANAAGIWDRVLLKEGGIEHIDKPDCWALTLMTTQTPYELTDFDTATNPAQFYRVTTPGL